MENSANEIGKWDILQADFYRQKSVVSIAKNLLGKILVTTFEGRITAGRIVETEAYNGEVDKAPHAFNGRRTSRTEIMYAMGGTSYVYLCYGIHHLFNVVTNEKDIPHAILIRALDPMIGIDLMLKRTGKKKLDYTLTKGPGNVSKAMGIHTSHSGVSLMEGDIFIADDHFKLKSSEIEATPRIGVDYAGDDAMLPYRFIIKNNNFVSGKKSKS